MTDCDDLALPNGDCANLFADVLDEGGEELDDASLYTVSETGVIKLSLGKPGRYFVRVEGEESTAYRLSATAGDAKLVEQIEPKTSG